MSAPKNLFPGGSCVTNQSDNFTKGSWGMTHINTPIDSNALTGVANQTVGASTMWNPGFGQFEDSPPQNSHHRRQDDQEQFYELNEGWKKDSDLIKNLRHHVAALGRIVDRKNEEIAELKRHNLALVEQIQTQHKQIDQLQTSLESLEKDKHETPPGKVMVDGVEWYRLGLKVRRLDEDFGARLKLLEDAHTSLASFIRRCVETISEAPKLGALEPRKEQGKEK